MTLLRVQYLQIDIEQMRVTMQYKRIIEQNIEIYEREAIWFFFRVHIEFFITFVVCYFLSERDITVTRISHDMDEVQAVARVSLTY